MATDAWVLQALVDAKDEAVFALDRDLRYLAFNRAHADGMRALYGAEVELGGRLTDYQTVEADRKGAVHNLELALAGERVVASAYSGEETRRRFYDLAHIPLVKDDEVIGVIVHTHDVTERHAAEAGLRAIEERYGLLFRSMREGCAYCRMLYDAEGKPIDFVHLAVNPAFERLTGLADVSGKRVTEVIPTIRTETPELFETYGAVARTGEPAEFDIDFTPLGMWLHVAAFQPEPDHFVAMFSDVSESRRAEQALRHSEGMLGRALAAAKAGTWEWDLASGSNSWSDELWELYDLDRDGREASYDLWLESIHPDDREGAAAAVAAAAAADQEINAEWRVNTRDGSLRWLASRGSPERAGGTVVRYVGVVMDVTKSKQAERDVLRGRAELKTLVDSIPEIVFQVDRDYRLVVANELFRQATVSAEGKPILPGDPILAPEYPDEFKERWRGFYDRALAGESFSVETTVPMEDGVHVMDNRLRPVRGADGEVAGAFVGSRDVTELKRGEHAARESEARYRGYFEQPLVGAAVTSPDKGWIEVNQAACDLLGYPRDELMRLTWEELTHPDDVAADVAHFDRVMAGETDGYRLEKRFVRKDGRIVDVDLSVQCRRAPGGDVDYFLALLMDITARKRAESVQTFLAHTGSGPGDEPFFETLARYLAESLDMFYVCIDRLEGDGLTAQTVAVWCDDHFEDNVSYALADTPCGEVAGQGVCCYPASVCRFFPRDQVLQDLRAESYVGITLLGHTGDPIGLIAVIGREPIPDRALAEATLALVAPRAAGELERLDAEARLREVHERLDMAQRASGVGIWDWDVVTGSVDWSDVMFELFGLDAATAPASFAAWNEALHPADRDVANARISSALASHSPLASEYRIVKPDGEVRWIEARGQGVYNEQGDPERMTGICIDVTDRRTTAEELRETRDYLENLFGYANAPVIVWDADLRITRFNHAFEELTLRSADEVVGRHLELLFPDDDRRAQALDHVTSATTGGERWQVVEIPIQRADGEVRTVLWNSATVLGADGTTPVATIAQGQDITERARAEAEIKRLNTDLERRVAERTRDLTAANAELEEFVYSIAHDLRAPLRSLSGFSQIIEHDYAEVVDETGRDYLRRIRDAAGHLGDLMDALLSLSRIGRRELDLDNVDLSALAREVAEALRDTDPERQADFEIEEGLVAKGDAALCELVVQNLLGNAWKFSVGETPALIRFGAERRDGRRVFCVSDNGVGFDPEYAGKLFAPFERLHTADQFPGTGIGLATVRRAVARLGGDCWADAEHGGGARLYFTLEEPG